MASAELGRVVLLNPATRQTALLPPFVPLFGSNEPVATKFGFGLHDEEDRVFRVLVIGYHENDGNGYCRIHVCTNSGGGIMALGYYMHDVNITSYCRAYVCSSPLVPDGGCGGEWRRSPILDRFPAVMSEGGEFILNTSQGAEFLEGAYSWLAMKGISVFIVSFNTRRERFGATTEVKGCFALGLDTVTTHVSLAVCMNELAMVLISWKSVSS